MRFHTVVTVIVAAIALMSCSATREALTPAPDPVLKGVSITQIRIETAPDIVTVWPSTAGMAKNAQIAEVMDALKASLASDVVGLPGGPRPARLVIVLNRVDLGSRMGGVLLSSNHEIVGSARVETIEDARVLGQARTIRGGESAPGSSSGPGNAAMLSLTMSLGPRGDLTRRLAGSFSEQVRRWLSPR